VHIVSKVTSSCNIGNIAPGPNNIHYHDKKVHALLPSPLTARHWISACSAMSRMRSDNLKEERVAVLILLQTSVTGSARCSF
jgi:hypothetical protein